jgi:hypothetical protein
VDHKIAKSRRGSEHTVQQQRREKAQSKAMKEKFDTFRGKKGLDFTNINNEGVWFAK